jgi:hypothetical protein
VIAHPGGTSLLKIRIFVHNVSPSIRLLSRIQSSAFKKFHFLFFLFAMVLTLLIAPLPAANAEDVTIGWDANGEPELEGYVVYRNAGSPGPPYDHADTLPESELADPLHPKATLTELKEGEEYYIALTAYNTEGIESEYSNDVCVEVVNGIADVCSQSLTADSDSSSGGGGSSGPCFIKTAGSEASMFSQWVARPVIRSQVLAMLFLLVVLVVAVKLGFNKPGQKTNR